MDTDLSWELCNWEKKERKGYKNAKVKKKVAYYNYKRLIYFMFN